MPYNLVVTALRREDRAVGASQKTCLSDMRGVVSSGEGHAADRNFNPDMFLHAERVGMFRG